MVVVSADVHRQDVRARRGLLACLRCPPRWRPLCPAGGWGLPRSQAALRLGLRAGLQQPRRVSRVWRMPASSTMHESLTVKPAPLGGRLGSPCGDQLLRVALPASAAARGDQLLHCCRLRASAQSGRQARGGTQSHLSADGLHALLGGPVPRLSSHEEPAADGHTPVESAHAPTLSDWCAGRTGAAPGRRDGAHGSAEPAHEQP